MISIVLHNLLGDHYIVVVLAASADVDGWLEPKFVDECRSCELVDRE
jgi:hypothetical protein